MKVLVDSGSSHNVMQPCIANHLNLPKSSTPSFPLMIGDGSSLTCNGRCFDVPLSIQGFYNSTSFFLLPIHGVGLVLGVEWLSTIGPVTFDFSVSSMSFTLDEALILLQGDNMHTKEVSYQ